jgi:hypothetical protein
MQAGLFDQLHQQGLLSDESLKKTKELFAKPVISLYRDLNVLLYSGVLLLSSGLGLLVYKNINSIGHLAIISSIAAICLFCYTYCYRKMPPFSWGEAESPDVLFNYLLVLGGLLLVLFIGYLQYQYRVFGDRWNMAAFIPMVLLFITAYYFDHLGVLALAITNLAAWLGITINRFTWPFLGNLKEKETIYAAILLGLFLTGMYYFSALSGRKAHFKNLYHQFGTHIFFISTIMAMIKFDPLYWPWFMLLVMGGTYHIFKAFKDTSFYYLVVGILYMYFGFSYMVLDLFEKSGAVPKTVGQIQMLYFIISALSLAFLLVMLNNKLKKDAGL